MERINRSKCEGGFTLIELTAAVSVMMLVITLMLPALGKIRDSGKTIVCASNQSQMIRGWFAAMVNNADQIPRTVNFYDPINKPWDDWSDVLYKAMGKAGNTTFTGGARFGTIACPHIESRFSGPTYEAHHYGYAINCRMRTGQSYGDNEGANWSQIRSPSSYPWFTDPAITVNGAVGAGKRYFGAVSSSAWGIGFYHGQARGSAAFADGHVASITEALLLGSPMDNSASPEPVPMWLLDTP